MGIQGFSHVGLCCSDLERSTRFYVDVLGFTEVFTMGMGDEVAATMEQQGARFESRLLRRDDVRVELLHWRSLDPSGDGMRRPMTALGMTHLCFRVDDIDVVAARVPGAGGEVHPSTRSVLPGAGEGGADVQLMYVTDPDGVRVELMSGTPALG